MNNNSNVENNRFQEVICITFHLILDYRRNKLLVSHLDERELDSAAVLINQSYTRQCAAISGAYAKC